jgi:hypothetical protein
MGRVLMLVGATLMLVSIPDTVRALCRERKRGVVSARTSAAALSIVGILVLTAASFLDGQPNVKLILALGGCVLALAALIFALRARRTARLL